MMLYLHTQITTWRIKIINRIAETENILKVTGFMDLLLKIIKTQPRRNLWFLRLSREKVDLKILLWLSTFLSQLSLRNPTSKWRPQKILNNVWNMLFVNDHKK